MKNHIKSSLKTNKIKVVFIHHHLRAGGVTTVLTRQIQALGNAVAPYIIVGEPPQVEVCVPYDIIPSLAYDRDRKDKSTPSTIFHTLIERIKYHFGSEPDLIHIHNPLLGKNKDFIHLIELLQKRGYRLLLQVHDFAEDGRPQNYQEHPYPSDVHYAVLNRRDYRFLLHAGFNRKGLHLLPNPVIPLDVPQVKVASKNLVLYPVRAIRRKNIGEAVLLSIFIPHENYVGITLEPTSQIDVQSYTGWQHFVSDKGLKVQFGLSIDKSFAKVIANSRCMITTSIREAFGYSYLEPWTAYRMLYGRILPDICMDYVEKGLDLSQLYECIEIPLALIDEKKLYQKTRHCYAERLRAYGLEVNDKRLDEIIEKLFIKGSVDFGFLSEDLQMQVIRGILNSTRKMKKLLDYNPHLKNITFSKDVKVTIYNNRKVVLNEYSMERYRMKLLRVYEMVLTTSIHHSIRKRILIDQFNTPERSHLLLCDSSYEA